jgi:GNAT superfamily N-acetyltransferase
MTLAEPTDVSVTPVRSWRDRKAFIQFPFDLYADSPYWVPPLRMDVAKLINPKKNAFFEHGDMQLFLARNPQGRVVGRIAAIRNGMHLKKYDDGVGFFGFWETIDDVAVSTALFEAAAGWLRQQGLRAMRGPTNPSMNDVAGLLVNGFDRQPAILMPYNHPWFVEHLTTLEFQRVMTMWAYWVHAKYINQEKLIRGSALLKRRYPDVTIRTMDKSRFTEEARLLMDIYNDAWSNNWGHVPMTEREFDQLASEMKQIIDERLVIFAEEKGEAIGFAVLLPDLNHAFKTLKNGRLLPTGLFKLLFLASSGVIHESRLPLMGVRKSHQGKAIDTMLVNEVVINGIGLGYLAADMSWILDNNYPMRNMLENMGSVKDKEYGMFEKAI